MAKLGRSYVRLRFRLGQGNVKGRQRYTNTAAYIARRVAFTYAEGMYDDIRKTLQHNIANDARRELVNLASLYRRHIVGANANTSRPAGVLRSVIGQDVEPLTLSSVLPSWAPRNAQYLRRKFNAVGHNNWFDNRGWRSGGSRGQWRPKETGLLFRESRADTWETIFGPIRVVFQKSHQLEAADATTTFSIGSGPNVKVQVGTIYVFAMSRLTPAMVPALRKGDANAMASQTGNPALMNVIKEWSPALAYRLGRKSSQTRRYRPTLEPFLGFFLTRAIPAAVARRIRQSTLRRIVRT